MGGYIVLLLKCYVYSGMLCIYIVGLSLPVKPRNQTRPLSGLLIDVSCTRKEKWERLSI